MKQRSLSELQQFKKLITRMSRFMECCTVSRRIVVLGISLEEHAILSPQSCRYIISSGKINSGPNSGVLLQRRNKPTNFTKTNKPNSFGI